MKKKYIILIAIFALIFVFFILFKCIREGITNASNKLVCFYCYFEKNEQYKKNFLFFLENGILDNVDYIIIINGECSVNIPNKQNIKVYTRPNIGLDFGGYSYGIKKLTNQYDYYFFINTSVCGPYTNGDWTVPFLKLFTKDVKVVGTSINIFPLDSYNDIDLTSLYKHPPPFPHVQSMFFVIDNEYFQYLETLDFFNEDMMSSADMTYTITHKEIGLSQYALMNGWNINCILPKYMNFDYRKIKNDINPTSYTGDPYFKGAYFGGTIDKADVIFFKNSRFPE